MVCYTSDCSRRPGPPASLGKEFVPTDPYAAFDSAYFRKYYFDAATRVTTAADMRGRAQLIAAVLRQAGIPVRRILDAGCGIGLLREAFAAAIPRARYEGLEASDYLCTRYQWTKGSVVDFAPRSPSDLVVCYDVLQYLGDRDAARAIANLAKLSRAAIYVSALTREDWRANCDRTRTDRAVHLRSGDWYRRRLRRRFNYVGLGVWLRKDVDAILWDLERPS
jgi:predicted TPR repeat methyltransferase